MRVYVDANGVAHAGGVTFVFPQTLAGATVDVAEVPVPVEVEWPDEWDQL